VGALVPLSALRKAAPLGPSPRTEERRIMLAAGLVLLVTALAVCLIVLTIMWMCSGPEDSYSF